MRSLPEWSVRALNAHFPEWAHTGQLEPEGDWRTWVLMAGRGFGKTRAGAEWVLSRVRASTTSTSSGQASLGMSERGYIPHPHPSPEGEGLSRVRVALACSRAEEVVEWSFARRRLLFANGAEMTLFSGAHPEGLRGPEHDFAWCDELAKWRHPGESWSNLQLGLRRGACPRALVTTTPRRVAALRAILGEAGVAVTGGASAANPHLPEAWVAAQEARLGASALGRQELGGELLDEAAGALWTRALIEGCRVEFPAAAVCAADPSPRSPDGESPLQSGSGVRSAPSTPQIVPGAQSTPAPDSNPLKGRGLFSRVLVGVDPPVGEGVCGIVVAGLGADGLGYVLDDHSAGGLTPAGWAARVAGAAAAHGADAVVAEANQGGAMVTAVLEGAGLRLPVLAVHAREGKAARAAPVAALFQAGRARFAGRFPALEDELAGLAADGRYEGPGRSPDRADAMVWALTKLMLGAQGEPSARWL